MDGADPALVAAWVHGWTISRGVPPPVAAFGGWRVEVGLPDQARRLVFAALGEPVVAAARAHAAPHVFVKAFASAASAEALMAPGWSVVSSDFVLMATPTLAPALPVAPDGYALTARPDGGAWCVQALTVGGDPAASGRIALASGAAVFDRVVTDPAHRRRGLGRAIMAELGRIAHDHGARRGLLVATDEGRALYEAIGWTVQAPYTSMLWRGEGAA